MKYKIITHNYPNAVKIIADGLMQGNDLVEKLRCSYMTNDENIIHIATAFEMADLDLPIDVIKHFTLYQVIE